MKKLIFLFLCAFMSCPLIADSVIDERVSDIYYGNGILTTKKEAGISKDILEKTILINIYHGDEAAMHAKHGDEIKLAYNSTFKTVPVAGIPGGELGEVAGGILDIMEIGFKRQPIGIFLKKQIRDYLIEKALPDYLATYISVQMTENDFARVKKPRKLT